MTQSIYAFILLCFCLPAFAQTDRIVNNIRQTVERINKDADYTTKTLTQDQFLENISDGGGKLTGYFKNGNLTKIVEWIGLSSCISVTEYYLKDNELIFVYAEGSESPYVDSTATFDHSKLAVTMECRFYFTKRTLIKSVLQGAIRCSGQPSDKWAQRFQDDCLRYLKLLKAK